MKRAALVLAVCLGAALPAAAFDHFNNFNLSGNASPGAMPNTPLGPTNSLEATMGYTLDAHDAAMVTVSLTGASYVSNPVKITKGVGTVKVRFSALCNPGTPATQTVNEVVLKMWDAQQKEITSARSAEKVSLTFTCPAAPAGTGKPDLVITSFGLQSAGTCAPGQMVFRFSVNVKNQGTGTWPATQHPAVVVKDMDPGVLDAWGTGVGIDPPLAPGQSKAMTIDVLYYAGNPSHMTSVATHPFRASVNDNHVVDESNFANNIGPGTYGTDFIKMGAPQGCPATKPNVPIQTGPAAGGRVAPPAPTPTLVPIR